jgi:hypothetical protein
MRAGIVGAGRIGGNAARLLVAAGHEVALYTPLGWPIRGLDAVKSPSASNNFAMPAQALLVSPLRGFRVPRRRAGLVSGRAASPPRTAGSAGW